MAPRTSIIIPVYKTADKVLTALESVLTQTDPDFEVLLLVDGSPDDSGQVLADYLAQNPDERVRLFDNPVNRGVSAVRNQGLDEARGQWIAFLDSDDTYRPQFLEKLHAHASALSADVVTSLLAIRKPDGTVTDRSGQELREFSGQEAAYELLRGQGVTPYVCDKIVRAELFDGVRFPADIHRGEDALTTLALCLKAEKVVTTPEVEYEYLMDSGGLTWGKITPVEESLRLMKAQEELLGPRLETAEGRRSFDTSWVITFLNSSQQALFNRGDEGKKTLRTNRSLLKWSQVFNAGRSNPVFGAAAALLKVSPAAYQLLYRAYVKRTYGLE